MQHRTLLLSPWYVPHRILRWQDAVTMIFVGKADVLVEYEAELRSPSMVMQAPAVIRFRGRMKYRRSAVKFSRLNVYLRDDFTCQYCGRRFLQRQLSFDHVVPRAAGGRTEWSNIVTACKPCNGRKGCQTCDEAGMWPRRLPTRPTSLPLGIGIPDVTQAPPEWLEFLPT